MLNIRLWNLASHYSLLRDFTMIRNKIASTVFLYYQDNHVALCSLIYDYDEFNKSLSQYFLSFCLSTFILSCPGSSLLFSSSGEQGLLPSFSAQASYWGGLHCCGAWAQQFWLLTLEHKLNNCGAQAELLCSMWNLPRSVVKPPALQVDSLPLSHQGNLNFLILN